MGRQASRILIITSRNQTITFAYPVLTGLSAATPAARLLLPEHFALKCQGKDTSWGGCATTSWKAQSKTITWGGLATIQEVPRGVIELEGGATSLNKPSLY